MRYPRFLRQVLASVLLASAAAIAAAQEPDAPPPPDGRDCYVVRLPSDQRARYRNPDGSCVQCSIGMCGVAQAVPAAEWLLWDSQYGTRVRGGSDPDRVKRYCDARLIPAYNIFGREAWPWLCWALENGRPAAITWGSRHMITAMGATFNAAGRIDQQSAIAICDNNSPTRVSWVPVPQFRRNFEAFGSSGWVVILRTPPPAHAAPFRVWWED